MSIQQYMGKCPLFFASCDLSLIFSAGIPVGSEKWSHGTSRRALWLSWSSTYFAFCWAMTLCSRFTWPYHHVLYWAKNWAKTLSFFKWEKGETPKKSTTCWPISIRFSRSGFDQQASLCTFRSEFVAEMAKDCKPRPTTVLGWSGSFTHGHLVWNIGSVHKFPWNMCGAKSPCSVHYRWLFLPWVLEILPQWYLNVYLPTHRPTYPCISYTGIIYIYIYIIHNFNQFYL